MKVTTLPTYNSNTPLVTAIEQAKEDARYLPGLYLRLLSEEILVLVDKSADKGFYTSNFNSNVSILKLPQDRIPVFTSPKYIYEGGAITTEVEYMKVKAASFFEMTVGSDIVINPFSKSALHLTANQLIHILGHSFFIGIPQVGALENNPKELKPLTLAPTLFIQALTAYFTTLPEIERAYIATSLDKTIESKPHYIIALECPTIQKAAFTKIMNRVSTICLDSVKGESFIEVIKLSDTHPHHAFFTAEACTFYTKK